MSDDANALFLPTIDDMEAEHYGLLVAALGEDSCDGYIATGRHLTERRALAAVHAYARHTDPGWLPRQIRDDLADGHRITITPTRFARDTDGGWTAHPHLTAPILAAWLVPPWHPAHTA